MKKTIISTLAFATLLSTTLIAGGYTLAPDGSYVSGDSYSLTPNGKYVSGNTSTLTPNGSYVGE